MSSFKDICNQVSDKVKQAYKEDPFYKAISNKPAQPVTWNDIEKSEESFWTAKPPMPNNISLKDKLCTALIAAGFSNAAVDEYTNSTAQTIIAVIYPQPIYVKYSLTDLKAYQAKGNEEGYIKSVVEHMKQSAFDVIFEENKKTHQNQPEHMAPSDIQDPNWAKASTWALGYSNIYQSNIVSDCTLYTPSKVAKLDGIGIANKPAPKSLAEMYGNVEPNIEPEEKPFAYGQNQIKYQHPGTTSNAAKYFDANPEAAKKLTK